MISVNVDPPSVETEDAVVVLAPDHVGAGGAAREPMRILDHRVEGALGRHERRAHPGRDGPGRAVVAGAPRAAARDPDEHRVRITRIDTHRVDAGRVIPAAEPLGPARLIPESAHEVPRVAAVGRPEEPARDGARPQRVRSIGMRGLDGPHHLRGPGRTGVAFAGPGLGIRRRGDLGELRRTRVAPMELRAEVAVVEHGVGGAVPSVLHTAVTGTPRNSTSATS